MKKLSKAEMDVLDTELMLTFDTTLTEVRYNEIMDALLPTLEGFPDAQATLRHFGKTEWITRRDARTVLSAAA